MQNKHPEHEQFELNFDGCASAAPADSCDRNPPICDSASDAEIFSFAEKVAQKTSKQDKQLYESILSRIKHLQY